MGRICVFRDHDLWHRADSTGFNKVGYFRDTGQVVYPIRKHFVEAPFDRIRKRKHQLLDSAMPEEAQRRAEQFFSGNVLNRHLMQRGLRAFADGESGFFRNPIRLPRLKTISLQEHETRWHELMACLKGGDVIQVLDQKSLISRLIARVDQGVWSHTAMYSGNGTVLEAITSGVTERPIGVYENARYRIGVYRRDGLTEEARLGLLLFLQSQLGKRYAWRKALRLGLRKVLRIDRLIGKQLSPNDLCLSDLSLIHLV